MNTEAIVGTALLFGISLIVRVAPAFARIDISEKRSEEIRTVLPIAVLINLMIYCVASEIKQHSLAAAAGFGVLTVLILFKRVNLLVMIVLASATYLAIR